MRKIENLILSIFCFSLSWQAAASDLNFECALVLYTPTQKYLGPRFSFSHADIEKDSILIDLQGIEIGLSVDTNHVDFVRM